MKTKAVLFISFIPILYFVTKAFLGEFSQYYFYSFVILILINVFFFKVFKKMIFLQYWLGILFSYMFLDIVFIKLDISQFFKSWMELNYFMIVPAMVLTIVSCVIQTFRWRTILSTINIFKFNQLFPSVMIGHLSNHILPAKAGELVKSYHLGKSFGLSKVSVFSTVVVERIFDGILVLSFLFLFIIGLNNVQSELLLIGLIGIIIYGGAFSIVVVIFKFNESLVTLSQSFLPKKASDFVEKIIRSSSEGLQIIGNIRQMMRVMVFSIFMWFIIAASIMPVMLMFDFQLPFYTSFAILACISLGLTIPSVPGGIGIISFATIFSMNILLKEMGHEITDVIYAKIVVFSILINIVLVVPEVILGTFFTIRTGSKLFSFYDEVST